MVPYVHPLHILIWIDISNRNIYRQTLYTHRQNKPGSVLWLNMLVKKDQLGSSFTVLAIQILEIDSLIQDWLRSWSACCREENG